MTVSRAWLTKAFAHCSGVVPIPKNSEARSGTSAASRRDALLGFQVEHLPGLVGEVFAPHRQFDAAVAATQQPAVAQLVDVAPDRLLRHAEAFGQRVNACEAGGLDHLDDVAGPQLGCLPVRRRRGFRCVEGNRLLRFHMKTITGGNYRTVTFK